MNIMKKELLVLLLMTIVGFDSCKNNANKQLDNPVLQEDALNPMTYENTFPFSTTDFIEVISYPNRKEWDKDLENNGSYIESGVIENGEVRIREDKIKDRIKLSNSQARQLFDNLYTYKCEDEVAAACYAPRHSFIFYDKDGKPFAAMEICLKCYVTRTTADFPPTQFCDQKIENLTKYFKTIGVKYFGEKKQ